MKKYIYIILFISSFSVRSQIIDSLNADPNPFVKRTGIYFSFSNNDTVSIKIYNNVGGLVTNLINLYTDSVMYSGIYHDSLKMDAYPDGIYFAHLILGHRKTIIKKVIKTAAAGIIINSQAFKSVKVSPNPTAGKLFVETTDIDKLTITNCLGIPIYILTDPAAKQEIDMSNFAAGIYYLKTEGKDGKKVFKIIKE